MQNMKFYQFWARENSSWSIWVESIAITLVILLICHYSNPDNPFYIRAIFAWPWLAAMIVALQCGFGPALVSIAIIVGAMLQKTSLATFATTTYQSYLLTAMLLTFICAIYSSNWLRRVLNASELHDYAEQRLDTLSRSYNMLRISYDYLEQNLIAKPVTLREIIFRLKKDLVNSDGEINRDTATKILNFIAQYCSLQSADIYLVKNNVIVPYAIAAIGQPENADVNDPLIQHVLRYNELSYVTINNITDTQKSNYIAVVPMHTNSSETIGLLAIKEMSFWNLNEEYLQIMYIILSYFVEEAADIAKSKDLLKMLPACPPDFIKEICKLIQLNKSIGVPSSIVTLIIPKSKQSNNILYSIKSNQRGFDLVWHHPFQNHDAIFTLMPFTDAVGMNGYIARMNNYLQDYYGATLKELGIISRFLSIYPDKPEVFLSELLANASAEINTHG